MSGCKRIAVRHDDAYLATDYGLFLARGIELEAYGTHTNLSLVRIDGKGNPALVVRSGSFNLQQELGVKEAKLLRDALTLAIEDIEAAETWSAMVGL